MLAVLEHSHNAEQIKTGKKKKTRQPSNVQNAAFRLSRHTAVGAVGCASSCSPALLVIVNWL